MSSETIAYENEHIDKFGMSSKIYADENQKHNKKFDMSSKTIACENQKHIDNTGRECESVAKMQINNLGKWSELLADEVKKPYFVELVKNIEREYAENVVFPPYEKVFNALSLTSFDEVKVVILGQDPYHEIGQATGLAFSVSEGTKLPPSLRNIYKEIADEFGGDVDTNGDLTYLAKQGVLLLNSTLTVREHQANSHKMYGWEIFTDKIIELVAKNKDVIFLLWGNDAIKKQAMLQNNIVITSAHPSPLSAYRGFLGSGQFRKVNEILRAQNKTEICWTRNKQN